MSTWDKHIGVIELLCEDLAAGRAFYTDVFGLTPEMEDETSVAFVLGQLLVILNDLPSGQELIEPVPVAPPEAGSRKCFTIGVADVDAVCAELEAKGVPLVSGPVNRRWGKRTANFADPGGHLYEIAGPIPARAEAPDGHAAGWDRETGWDREIGVVELFYDDLAAAKAFYTGVFGLAVDREDDTSVSFLMGDLVVILLGPDGARELIAPVPVARQDDGARMCFTIMVQDLDAVCDELTAKGVTLLAGPSVRPWGPYAAYVADPGGHIYELAEDRD